MMIGWYLVWGYVVVFVEVVMIGVMVDWFVVVVLFCYFFGILIWYIVIIFNKKDEIGCNFGEFVENYFIIEEGIV